MPFTYIKVNCQFFEQGKCLHGAVPSVGWFSARPACIYVIKPGDIRHRECALKLERPRPPAPPAPPKPRTANPHWTGY